MWSREISLPPCCPAKGGLVSRVSQASRLRIRASWLGTLVVVVFAIIVLSVGRHSSAQSKNSEPNSGRNSEPPVRVPSNVAWTEETLTMVSSGDAFRGLLLARRCNHCHGEEGFSSVPDFPNLA